jgi:hypothetical protein
MHALPMIPRSPLLAGAIVLLLALLGALAAAPDLGSLDLSLGGGATGAEAPAAQPAVDGAAKVGAPGAPLPLGPDLVSPIDRLVGAR